MDIFLILLIGSEENSEKLRAPIVNLKAGIYVAEN